MQKKNIIIIIFNISCKKEIWFKIMYTYFLLIYIIVFTIQFKKKSIPQNNLMNIY